MKIRGLYSQKKSPFYWVRYYDKLEPEKSKRSKSICSKIDISTSDRKRIDEAQKTGTRPSLKGTPEIRDFVESFRKGLNEVYIETKTRIRLKEKLTLSNAFEKFKEMRSLPGKKDELKAKSLLNYEKSVEHFIIACGDRDVYSYTQDDFHKLLQYFENYKFNIRTDKVGNKTCKEMSQTTRSIYVRTLKALWSHFLKQGLVREQIFENLRIEEGDPQPIPLEDLWRIISHLEDNTNYPNAYNLIKFLFLTGCRVSSALVQLKENIDFDEKIIKIQNVKSGRRKGKDVYQFPLYGELEKLLRNQLNVRPGEGGRLFEHFKINELDYTSPLGFWDRAINFLVKHKRIKKRYTLKQIRSTAATYFINNMRFDIYRVKKLLDHSDVKVTEKNYIRYDVDMVREILDEEMKMSKLLQNALEKGITVV
jgi:integrase